MSPLKFRSQNQKVVADCWKQIRNNQNISSFLILAFLSSDSVSFSPFAHYYHYYWIVRKDALMANNRNMTKKWSIHKLYVIVSITFMIYASHKYWIEKFLSPAVHLSLQHFVHQPVIKRKWHFTIEHILTKLIEVVDSKILV